MGLHRVHKHPPYEGRCCAFVKAPYSLVSNGLHYAVDGASELGFLGGLESDFDCVEAGPCQ